MRRALLALLLFLPLLARAEWVVEVRWDEMSDAREPLVYDDNAQGHRLFFYRADNGTVRATLQPKAALLRGLVCDQFPVYRLDRGKPVDLGADGNTQAARCTGDAVGWLAFEAATWPLRGPMASAVTGGRLLVRFVRGSTIATNDGQAEDTSFDLAGLERALRLAVELMAPPSR